MRYNRTIPPAKHHYTELPSDQYPILPEQAPTYQVDRKDYAPHIPLLDLAAIARSIH